MVEIRRWKIDPHTLVKSLPCAFIVAIALGIVTSLFMPSYFSIIGICFYTMIYFPVYLIFIVPIQIILNQKSRKFPVPYFLIYSCGSFFASAIIIMLNGENPFTISYYYVFAFLAAIMIWMVDSLILQDG